MKKLLLLGCMFAAAACAFSQKSYVVATTYGDYIALSGDIPEGIDQGYDSTDFGIKYGPASLWVGYVLNLLAEKGFTVEQANTTYGGDRIIYNYLLSRDAAAADTSTPVRHTSADAGGEVREVARYNLQGRPVGKAEKGIQVIVFSNYTTKTVIVE